MASLLETGKSMSSQGRAPLNQSSDWERAGALLTSCIYLWICSPRVRSTCGTQEVLVNILVQGSYCRNCRSSYRTLSNRYICAKAKNLFRQFYQLIPGIYCHNCMEESEVESFTTIFQLLQK